MYTLIMTMKTKDPAQNPSIQTVAGFKKYSHARDAGNKWRGTTIEMLTDIEASYVVIDNDPVDYNPANTPRVTAYVGKAEKDYTNGNR